jgi:hypothetical protein
MKISKILFFLLTLMFFLLLAFLLGTQFFEFGTDFGIYYKTGDMITKSSTLYKDIFDNKGPVYPLFISMIVRLFSNSVITAYIAYSLTLFLLLI